MVKNIVIDKEIMDIVNKYVEVILANYKVKAINDDGFLTVIDKNNKEYTIMTGDIL